MPVVFIGVGVAVGLIVLGFFYYTWQKQLTEENNRIKTLRAQKTELEQIKQQVETFEKQKTILQQRVATIEQLQRDRTGGQELLDADGKPVADGDGPQGQYPVAGRVLSIDQFRSKFHYRAEAFRVFPESGNQGIEAGREEYGHTNVRFPDVG